VAVGDAVDESVGSIKPGGRGVVHLVAGDDRDAVRGPEVMEETVSAAPLGSESLASTFTVTVLSGVVEAEIIFRYERLVDGDGIVLDVLIRCVASP